MLTFCNHDTLYRMIDEIIEKKRILRDILLKERDRIPAADARATDAQIASHIFNANFYRDAGAVFVFINAVGEVDTMSIIHRAFADGKRVLVPRTKKDRILESVPVEEEEFFQRARTEWPRAFGIPEPPDRFPPADASDIDLVIVPSLALDKMGYRLGYGGGYYDHFVATVRKQKKCPVFAAVQRAVFVRDEILPREPYDMAVDIIVTENGIVIPSSCV